MLLLRQSSFLPVLGRRLLDGLSLLAATLLLRHIIVAIIGTLVAALLPSLLRPRLGALALLLLSPITLRPGRTTPFATTLARIRNISVALLRPAAALLLLDAHRLGEHQGVLRLLLVLLALGQHLLLGAIALLLKPLTLHLLVALERRSIVLLFLANLALLEIDLASRDDVMLGLGQQIGALAGLDGGESDVEAGFVAVHREVGEVPASEYWK